ncbi:MAG TPA: glycosyltransferase family 2 protein [Coxiellaceae bacterium]|nr:glycosyltransferase family 2 protein [Coxiellaceae bacterium]
MDIAVLIPCYNEAPTIATLIRLFQHHLPEATVYVYDNASTDATALEATQVGARVRKVWDRGKGNVIRRMFAEIEADIYVMMDGDLTYDIATVSTMIRMLQDQQLDMVVGKRVISTQEASSYRRGHQWGNWFFNRALHYLFKSPFTDILSGYRVVSRRFVKSFAATACGFDTEVELSLHALELKLPSLEKETLYAGRPEGSHSKLHTLRDGFKILFRILSLLKRIRPLFLFSIMGMGLALLSLGLAVPLFITYWHTGLVPRFPTAVLSTGIMILAGISIMLGIVLDHVSSMRRELKYLHYLSLSKTSGRVDEYNV